jgi:carbamoyltransferase
MNARSAFQASERSPVVVGVSGARQNAAVAVCVGSDVKAFCEQERVTRVRRAGLIAGSLPAEALSAALQAAGSIDPAEIQTFVTAEPGIVLPPHLPCVQVDHHHAHAATAFGLSSFDTGAVVVCDRHSVEPLSVWLGGAKGMVRQDWPAAGAGFASIYGECAELFGFPAGQEHELEGLARLDAGGEAHRFTDLVEYRDGGPHVSPHWRAAVAAWLDERGPHDLRHRARVASAFQKHLGDLLNRLVADVCGRVGASRLCLGGGLFYNTYFTTRLQQSAIFEDVSIAPNPGNAGAAIGAVIAATGERCGHSKTVSPFLGPDYAVEDLKRTLDNCKLSYERLDESAVIAAVVDALVRGQLVGWFQGRMEWGHRALGNRSILASPLSPYVLDNLNVFLKQRQRHRTYGVSVREEDAPAWFSGPPTSRHMEFEYWPTNPDVFRWMLPEGAATLRVQTIPDGAAEESARRFRRLHEAFGQASGVPVLINTSFNGFAEPMVCSPRDAIRVFYGTGLDLLVLDRFIVRK